MSVVIYLYRKKERVKNTVDWLNIGFLSQLLYFLGVRELHVAGETVIQVSFCNNVRNTHDHKLDHLFIGLSLSSGSSYFHQDFSI